MKGPQVAFLSNLYSFIFSYNDYNWERIEVHSRNLRRRVVKYFNWWALTTVSLEDAIIFLLWLEAAPSGRVSLVELRNASPVKICKHRDLIKVLTHFGLVTGDRDQVSISSEGKRFVWSSINTRLAILRGLFLQGEPARRIVALLRRTESGRVTVTDVVNLFQEIYGFYISRSEVYGFLEWGAQCRLFGLAKGTYELQYIEDKFTNENSRSYISPNEALTSPG